MMSIKWGTFMFALWDILIGCNCHLKTEYVDLASFLCKNDLIIWPLLGGDESWPFVLCILHGFQHNKTVSPICDSGRCVTPTHGLLLNNFSYPREILNFLFETGNIKSQFAKLNTGTSKLKRNNNPEESPKETLFGKGANKINTTRRLHNAMCTCKQVIFFWLGSSLC